MNDYEDVMEGCRSMAIHFFAFVRWLLIDKQRLSKRGR